MAVSADASGHKPAPDPGEAHRPLPALTPLLLALSGALFGCLAAFDKYAGLVQQPLLFATLAYASLLGLVAWVRLRGVRIQEHPAAGVRPIRASGYGALLFAVVLTAGYVWAWRVSADSTPLLLQQQLSAGDALLAEGNKDAAHLAYLQVYKRYPKSYAVLMALGAVNYRLGDYERAERYYTRAVALAPAGSRYRALSDLGQTYWKLHQPDMALEYYDRAKAAGIPAGAEIEWHYRVAWASFDVGDLLAAIKNYQVVADAGQKYAAASFWNIACAQAQQLKKQTDEDVRQALITSAVQNLRQAWRHSETPEERDFVQSGLLGGPEDRDPELAPLTKTPQFQAFLKEFQGK